MDNKKKVKHEYMGCMKKKLKISDAVVEGKEIEGLEDIIIEDETETITGTAAGNIPPTPTPAKNERAVISVK